MTPLARAARGALAPIALATAAILSDAAGLAQATAPLVLAGASLLAARRFRAVFREFAPRPTAA